MFPPRSPAESGRFVQWSECDYKPFCSSSVLAGCLAIYSASGLGLGEEVVRLRFLLA